MDLNAFFYTHPVFRHEEFVAWKTQNNRLLKATSINTALQYYLKTGRIVSIHRGLFAVIPPDQSAETVIVDRYLIAAKAAPDSILAYHTALELHGIAYSTFEQSTYLTLKKNKPFEFQNQWFQATAHPTALKKIQRTSIGTQTINRQGIDIQSLSVDIDLNYIGALDKETILKEKVILNNAIA